MSTTWEAFETVVVNDDGSLRSVTRYRPVVGWLPNDSPPPAWSFHPMIEKVFDTEIAQERKIQAGQPLQTAICSKPTRKMKEYRKWKRRLEKLKNKMYKGVLERRRSVKGPKRLVESM